MVARRDLTPRHYRALAEFRHQVRSFLAFSESAAREVGVEPQQHQLLLVLVALPPDERPTVAFVARRLFIQHNSAVDLVKRSVERGLVERRTSAEDRREAHLHITAAGRRVLRRLSLAHHEELKAAAPGLAETLASIVEQTGRKRS